MKAARCFCALNWRGSTTDGFRGVYRAAKDDCFRTVLVSVGDRDTAQDLVAEAFARAWASRRTVSRHPVPAAWVVRTALNANVSRWRRKAKVTPGRVVGRAVRNGPDQRRPPRRHGQRPQRRPGVQAVPPRTLACCPGGGGWVRRCW